MRGDNMIISIVGLSGSGKSFIANILQNYNPRIIHLDIDKVGHNIYSNPKVIEEMIQEFGTEIMRDGQINRKILGQIVFSSPQKMQRLEDITWYHMEQEIDEFIADNQDKIILLDWLLLPKTKYFTNSDLRILITASYETRLNRAMKRDQITAKEFALRNQAAPIIDESQFEYIIHNEELTKTQEEVRKIYDKSIIHR